MRDIVIETRVLHAHERLEDAGKIVLFDADALIAHRDLIEPEALVEGIELTCTQHDRTSFGRKGRSVFDDRSQSAIEIAEIRLHIRMVDLDRDFHILLAPIEAALPFGRA